MTPVLWSRTFARLGLLFALLLCLPATVSQAAESPADRIAFFETEVRPLLAEQCFACHSAKLDPPLAGLRLDTLEAVLQGGDSGPALVPGKPAESRIMHLLRGQPTVMPPTGRLPDEQIETVATWIRMGAPWPEAGDSGADPATAFDLETRKAEHWAWQPVRDPSPPNPRNGSWARTPADRFLLARLETEGLQPAADADRRTLIRRLSFDLTGLPPTPSEVAAFVADESPHAYASVVQRMLDSERFGERWARHWMDWVRYADSHGSEGDPQVEHAWQYRDYLIRAINGDTPYDQLVQEHLAGDLLEDPRMSADGRVNESVLGTAHLRLGELGYQPVDPWEERIKWTDNQIDVFSKTFQGMTVACARCHDHKFDAISQDDYYALFGVFYGARPTMRTVETPQAMRADAEALGDLKDDIRSALAGTWIESAKALALKLTDDTDTVLRRAIEEAACDEASPLHVWLELRDLDGEALGHAWRQTQDRWERDIQARRAFNAEHFERIWDLGAEDYDGWLRHGTNVADKPSAPGEFAIAPEGDLAIEGIYPRGVYTHLLSDKHAGVLQSPRFKIDTDAVSVKVLGGDTSFARLMIENYPLPLGGIYHQRYSPRSDEMRWWRWDTTFWKGFTAYVEFTTRDDSTNFSLDPIDSQKKPRPTRPDAGRSAIGAAAVALHNGKELPRATVEPVLEMLAAPAPKSADALAGLTAAVLVDAVKAWRDDRLGDRQAAFLDYFVRRDLLPRALDDLATAKPLVEQYRKLEARITVPQRFPSVIDEGSPDQPLLVRGVASKPGHVVPRQFLTAIGSSPYTEPTSVRLRLAEDVIRTDNPLTARVMVNRVWQKLFGRGIVATPDNFGALGERPSHPELLDYLASRFVEDGWSLKKLVERIVTSRAYGMASMGSAEARERDPLNALVQHMPVRRLDAEAIRDALLAVSGRLDITMYGSYGDRRKMYSQGPPPEGIEYGNDRRSVYQEVRRNRTNPLLEVFDRPTPSTTRGRRDVTNVPAQSLMLMNSPFVLDASTAWGDSLAKGEGHSLDSRLRYMFVKVLGREPESAELEDARAFVAVLADENNIAERDVLQAKPVWRSFAHAMFNFKEFVYVR